MEVLGLLMSTPAPATAPARALAEKIEARTARAAVVGLGYVGLPLAVELARAGYSAIGVESSAEKVAALGRGQSYIPDVEAALFAQLVADGRFEAFTDDSVLETADTISICVPTPLRKTKDPDLSHVITAAESVAKRVKPGALIILESTTYPGTTEELILPILEHSGRRVGQDFFLCFSPERVDPGNARFRTRDIPKVLGGVTEDCTRLGAALYEKVVERVVPVGSPRVAEMVKLLENTFRMINIGLANEMAIMCSHVGVDVWEVIEAAATKPFGFMPFYPGPGLGGHCIPVDPHYLSWKTKQAGYEPRFIQLASEINGRMPAFVVDKIQQALNGVRKAVNGAKVHLVGVAYKRNVADLRESPALDIAGLLERMGADVGFSDPFVAALRLGDRELEGRPLDEAAPEADCVVVITDHDGVDYMLLAEKASLIVDTRNALKGVAGDHIVRL